MTNTILLLINLLTIPIGALLWFLGGRGADLDYDKDVPQLHKSWRREVWPMISAIIWCLNGMGFLQASLIMGAKVGVLHLGYGEKVPVWRQILVSFLLGLPAWLIYHSWVWPVVTAITFSSLHWLSLKKNWMSWPVVEAIVGATQGAVEIAALMTR